MRIFPKGFSFILLTALWLMGPRPAEAQTLEPSVSVTALSAFIDQGERISSRPVLQPEATLAIGWVTVGTFANIDAPFGDTQSFKMNQWDVYGAVALPTGPVETVAGYGYSAVPVYTNGSLSLEPTHELFADATVPVGRFVPRVHGLVDLWADGGAFYGELGLTREVQLGLNLFQVEAVLASASGYFTDDLVLSHAALQVTYGFDIGTATIEFLGGAQLSINETYRDLSSRFPVVIGARLVL